MAGKTKTMGHLTATSGVDRSGFHRDYATLKREAQQAGLEVKVRTTSDGGERTRTEIRATRDEVRKAADEDRKLAQEGRQRLRDQAATRQLNTRLAAQEAAEERRLAQEGQQRLRDQAVSVRLNTRLRTEADRETSASARAAAADERRLSLEGQQRLKDQAATRQLNARIAAQAAAEEKRLAQEGAQRLRDQSATITLNARLSAQAEREAQAVVRAALKERTDLLDGVRLAHARARAEYDRASGQGADLAAKTRAAVAYRDAVRSIEAAMTAMGQRTDWTNRELTQMALLQQRIARDRTALSGGVSTLGLSGTVSNAMSANLPRFITAMQNSAASLSPILNTLSPSLGAAAANTSTLAARFTTLAGAATPLALALPLVAVAAVSVGRGIMTSVNAYAELEKAMNGLKASSGASKAELFALREGAQNVGREFGFLTRDVVAVQEELAKGGVSVGNIASGAAEAVAVLAKATGVDFKTAVGIAVPVMNVWNMSGAQMMQVADAISNGANKSALDVAGLALSLQQVANSAESSGLSMTETVAVLASLADRGMQGSDAGTSLKVMLQRLTAPTKEATAALKEHSVAVFDSAGKQRSMIAVLVDVMDAMDGMTDKQRSAFMMTVFGSDASRAITSSWRTGKSTLREYIATMGEQGTAIQNAKTRTEGLRGAQDRMNSAWDAFKTKIGEVFTPAMTTVINMTTTAIDKLTAFADLVNKGINGTPISDAGNEMRRLQWDRQQQVDTLRIGEQQLAQTTDKAMRTQLAGQIQQIKDEIAKLDGQIAEAKKVYDNAQAQIVQSGKSGLDPRFAGPRFGGDDAPKVGYNDAANLSQYAGDVLRQTAQKTGKSTADMVVDYCAQWTRITLGNADKRAKDYINKLFSGDVDKDGLVTANDYAKKARAAGLMRGYKSTKDLQPGDTVFYEDNGAGHVGIYIGGGKVRGNNRVTYAANGGKFDANGNPISKGINPVGNVDIDRLGKVTGYVSASELGRAAGLTERDLRLNTAPTPPGAATKVKGPASDQALIAEARRILTRIEDLTDKGDLTGKVKAEGVLKVFEKGGPRSAAALEVARKQLAELDKEVSKFGQGYDALKRRMDTSESMFKLNDDAAAYAKGLEGISKAALEAAAAERKRFGETDKYVALRDLSSDAAGKARAQREAIQREADAEDKDAETRVANRLKSQQALSSALAEGREGDAQRSLDELKDQQQQELKLYKDDAAKRAQVIERTGPEIIAAEDKLANLRRDRRVAQAKLDAEEALKVPGADPVAIEKTRREAVRQAYADAAADRAKARRQQEEAERTADDAAEEAAKQVRANRLAAERALTDGRIELAQKGAQAVVTGYDDAVKAAGESAREQLAVEERLGRDVLAARNVLSTVTAETEKTRLERERNTAVNATGLTLKQRQALWSQYNARISQVDSDLQATLVRNGQESARTLDAAWSKLFSEDDADRAKAYGEKVQGILASIPGQDEEGLLRIYTEASAFRDTQLMNAVFDELERRREAEATSVRTLLGDAAEATAQLVLDSANELTSKGDLRGALKVLQDGIGNVQAQAVAGAPAAAALERLYTAVNNLTDAGKRLSGDAAALAFWQGASDAARLMPETLDSQVAALRPRPAKVDPYAPPLPTSVDLNAQRAAALRTRLSTLGDVGDELTTDPDGTVVVRVRVEDDQELNRTLLEASNLLNSDIGRSLPESVRQGLEDAVAGAQAYKAALASITEEGVADGASVAIANAKRQGAPENLFERSAQQVFKMQADGDLADPVKVQALRQALEILRQSSNLTDDQLRNLNATIDELTGDRTPVEIGRWFDLPQWQRDIQELGDEFDAGQIDAATFTERLQLAGDRLREYAKEADAAGNPKLAQAFRDQADSLRAMNPQIAGLLQRLGKVQDYAGYVQQAAGAFGQLAGALGESEEDYDRLTGQKLQTPWKDLAANLDGVANAAGKVVELVGDVMAVVSNPADIGAWVKLVTNVVRSIADAIAGFAKARAEVQRLKADFQEANPLLNGADYQNSYTRSRGFFADVFGGGPEVVNEIDKIGLPVAQSIAGAITSGITSGFDAYAQSGNLEDFSKAMNAELTKGIKAALVQGFLEDPQRKNDYAGLIKAFSDAWKTHDPAQIMAAAQGIYAQTQATAAAARDLAEQMDALDRLNGTGRYSPEAIAQRARDLASQGLGVEEQQLERLHTKGLISTAEYEDRKLDLALRRIEIERQTALAAAGLTAEQILLINQQFDEAAGLAQDQLAAQRLEKAKQFAKDLSGLTMNNAETALSIEEKLAASLATTEEEKYNVQRTYAARRLALTLDRLTVEEAAEKALVDMSLAGAQAMIDAISEKYRLARESAGTEVTLLERSYAAQQEAARQSALNAFTGQWASIGATAFMAGLEKADFSTFLSQWRGNLTQATIQALAEAEIGRVVSAELLPLAERYRMLSTTGSAADKAAALADLRSGVTHAAAEVRPLFESLQPLWADLKSELAENTAATKENTEAKKAEVFSQTTLDVSTLLPTRSGALRAILTR